MQLVNVAKRGLIIGASLVFSNHLLADPSLLEARIAAESKEVHDTKKEIDKEASALSLKIEALETRIDDLETRKPFIENDWQHQLNEQTQTLKASQKKARIDLAQLNKVRENLAAQYEQKVKEIGEQYQTIRETAESQYQNTKKRLAEDEKEDLSEFDKIHDSTFQQILDTLKSEDYERPLELAKATLVEIGKLDRKIEAIQQAISERTSQILAIKTNLEREFTAKLDEIDEMILDASEEISRLSENHETVRSRSNTQDRNLAQIKADALKSVIEGSLDELPEQTRQSCRALWTEKGSRLAKLMGQFPYVVTSKIHQKYLKDIEKPTLFYDFYDKNMGLYLYLPKIGDDFGGKYYIPLCEFYEVLRETEEGRVSPPKLVTYQDTKMEISNEILGTLWNARQHIKITLDTDNNDDYGDPVTIRFTLRDKKWTALKLYKPTSSKPVQTNDNFILGETEGAVHKALGEDRFFPMLERINFYKQTRHFSGLKSMFLKELIH